MARRWDASSFQLATSSNTKEQGQQCCKCSLNKDLAYFEDDLLKFSLVHNHFLKGLDQAFAEVREMMDNEYNQSYKDIHKETYNKSTVEDKKKTGRKDPMIVWMSARRVKKTVVLG